MPMDAGDFLAALAAMKDRVDAASRGISSRGALVAQRDIMSKLHTGYGVVSGTMRRSVHTLPTAGGDGVYSTKVSPGVIYARRFDLGFEGADSLGRVYHQVPRPFVKPGLMDNKPKIRDLAQSMWAAAIQG